MHEWIMLCVWMSHGMYTNYDICIHKSWVVRIKMLSVLMSHVMHKWIMLYVSANKNLQQHTQHSLAPFVLTCVAVCCSVLEYVAVCCHVLQYVAVCCSVLPCVAVHCSVLQYVAVCGSMLQCGAVCCSVLQLSAKFRLDLCCSVLQCAAVYCSVL